MKKTLFTAFVVIGSLAGAETASAQILSIICDPAGFRGTSWNGDCSQIYGGRQYPARVWHDDRDRRGPDIRVKIVIPIPGTPQYPPPVGGYPVPVPVPVPVPTYPPAYPSPAQSQGGTYGTQADVAFPMYNRTGAVVELYARGGGGERTLVYRFRPGSSNVVPPGNYEAWMRLPAAGGGEEFVEAEIRVTGDARAWEIVPRKEAR